MEDQHLSQQSFAQMTQISTPTLSNILTGKSRATLNTVELIKRKFPLISLEWLLYGIGPMYVREDASPTPSEGSTSNEHSGQREPAPQVSSSTEGSLFDAPTGHGVNYTRNNSPKTEVKYIDKPQRKITEIRIFYDDQTWETFVPKK